MNSAIFGSRMLSKFLFTVFLAAFTIFTDSAPAAHVAAGNISKSEKVIASNGVGTSSGAIFDIQKHSF